MFRRIGHLLVIFALLAATGAQWPLLQSLAWTTMLASNLRSVSICEAVQRTFDGKHPCRLCRQIAKGKQAEKKSNIRSEWKKLEFSYAPLVLVFSAPSCFHEMRALND